MPEEEPLPQGLIAYMAKARTIRAICLECGRIITVDIRRFGSGDPF